MAEGTVEGGVASIIDMAPTLLGLADAPPLRLGRGRSLLAGSGGAEPAISELYVGSRQLAIRRPDVTVVVDEQAHALEVYDPSVDPGESTPLPPDQNATYLPLVVQTMKGLRAAAAEQSAPGERPAVPDATKEQLRSLGYIP